MTSLPTPHVAETIEPGAILYASWGYDQTNIDFYMVTRCTKASAWIVPMSSSRTEREEGFSPDSEHVIAGLPMSTDRWGKAITPKMHRIRRESYGEFLTLTSYSSASLWSGSPLYASHYA